MRIPYLYLFLFLLFTIVWWHCDTISSSGDYPNADYPTTLHALSKAELDSLRIIFNQKLGSTYIARLDSFGLIGDTSAWIYDTTTISNPDEAVSLAKAALVYLKDFSNVTDTSMLYLNDVYKNSSSNTSRWDIGFRRQQIDGLEVHNSSVYAIVTDNHIILNGHFYRDVLIPTKNIISKANAKRNLVGNTIHFDCWTPSSFEITDSTINLDSMKICVYPLHKNQTIELRVAWQIPVSYSLYSSPHWFFFIDLVTGRVIGSKQLFIC